MEMMVRSHVRMEPSKLLGRGVQIPEGFLEAGVKGMAGRVRSWWLGRIRMWGGWARGARIFEVTATRTRKTDMGDKEDTHGSP